MFHALIIEDEPLIAMDLQQVLEDEGCDSFAFAQSEEQAVAAAIAMRPDIITSDVSLLHGTGPHAVRAIHERLGAIPVIFMTGTPERCTPCDPPGVVLRKPVDPDALARALHLLCD
jgi:CheY-like chemotaxis protein